MPDVGGRGPHALPLRHRVGRATRADPVRHHRDGRRVRRRDPGRPVRDHRRRLDRSRRSSRRSTGHRSRAVLMANHGVFTIGKDAKDAVKAAVMCEDVRPHRAHRPPARRAVPIPPNTIDALFDRYQNVYGQAPKEHSMSSQHHCRTSPNRGLVPHRQPDLYGAEIAGPGGRAVEARRRAARTPRATSRARSCGSRC